MKINRPWWVNLILVGLTVFYLACALVVACLKTDKTMIALYIAAALFFTVLHATTYSFVSPVSIVQRKFFFWEKTMPFEQIVAIRPSERTKKWRTGKAIEIVDKNNRKMLIQPADPYFIAAELHRLAPQAEYLF